MTAPAAAPQFDRRLRFGHDNPCRAGDPAAAPGRDRTVATAPTRRPRGAATLLPALMRNRRLAAANQPTARRRAERPPSQDRPRPPWSGRRSGGSIPASTTDPTPPTLRWPT